MLSNDYAFVWEKFQTWERVYTGRDVLAARAIADLCQEPIHSDDDAHQAKIFETYAVGTLVRFSEESFGTLKKGQTLILHGETVHVTKRISTDLIEVYVDSRVAYEVVARR